MLGPPLKLALYGGRARHPRGGVLANTAPRDGRRAPQLFGAALRDEGEAYARSACLEIVLAWLVGVMVLTGCAEMQPRGEHDPAGGRVARFEFGVIGDAPISSRRRRSRGGHCRYEPIRPGLRRSRGRHTGRPRVPYPAASDLHRCSLERRKELFGRPAIPSSSPPGIMTGPTAISSRIGLSTRSNAWPDCARSFPTRQSGAAQDRPDGASGDPRYGNMSRTASGHTAACCSPRCTSSAATTITGRTPEMDAE